VVVDQVLLDKGVDVCAKTPGGCTAYAFSAMFMHGLLRTHTHTHTITNVSRDARTPTHTQYMHTRTSLSVSLSHTCMDKSCIHGYVVNWRRCSIWRHFAYVETLRHGWFIDT